MNHDISTKIALGEMNHDIPTQKALEEMVSKIEQMECILFLGAGVHAPPPLKSPYHYPAEASPPIGGTLAESLADECGFKDQCPEESCRDLQRVALCYELTRGRQSLVDSLEKHLQEGKTPSPALKMLAALPFSIIVTTNYDHLLEEALRQAGKTHVQKIVYNPAFQARTRDISRDPTDEKPLLFKIHGDISERETIVISDEDYITFIQRMTEKEGTHPVPGTVRYRMQRWPTLFIGYSLRDYNLRLLFRTLHLRLDASEYAVSYSIDRKPDRLIQAVWQHEKKLITFIADDLWSFVPWLYREIKGEEYPP